MSNSPKCALWTWNPIHLYNNNDTNIFNAKREHQLLRTDTQHIYLSPPKHIYIYKKRNKTKFICPIEAACSTAPHTVRRCLFTPSVPVRPFAPNLYEPFWDEDQSISRLFALREYRRAFAPAAEAVHYLGNGKHLSDFELRLKLVESGTSLPVGRSRYIRRCVRTALF